MRSEAARATTVELDEVNVPASRRRWPRRLLMLFIAFCVALVVTELALRLWTPHFLGYVEAGRGAFTSDGAGEIVPVPNFRSTYRAHGRTAPLNWNNIGLRGADIGPKRERERRVLIFGDSMVYGVGLAAADTFPARLDERFDDRGTTVGNGGVPGFSPRNYAAALKRLDASFDADAVILCVYLGNDFTDECHVHRTVVDGYSLAGSIARVAEQSLHARLVIRFRTLWWVERFCRSNIPSLAIDISGVEIPPEERAAEALLPSPMLGAPTGLIMDYLDDPQRVDALYERLAGSVRALKERVTPRPLALVVVPTRWHFVPGAFETRIKELGLDPAKFEEGRSRARLRRLAEDLKADWVDLTPAFRAVEDGESLLIGADIHLSERGHALIAETLAQRLQHFFAK